MECLHIVWLLHTRAWHHLGKKHSCEGVGSGLKQAALSWNAIFTCKNDQQAIAVPDAGLWQTPSRK